MSWGGKDKPTKGTNGSRFATPGNKIKQERKERDARAASVHAQKVEKGKHW